MKIAVASCVAYRDAWEPFLKLFRKFWPSCSHELLLITDEKKPGQSWCGVVSDFAAQQKEPILLMQEDFFLSAPVVEWLVDLALYQLSERNAAMIRLYPCPGGDILGSDMWYAEISKDAAYRVSCQATIWRPDVLHEIASHFNTPAEFEIDGTQLSKQFSDTFLACRRDAHPWPISYYCSAISRGKWEPDAVAFCRANGIEVDTSMRGIA